MRLLTLAGVHFRRQLHGRSSGLEDARMTPAQAAWMEALARLHGAKAVQRAALLRLEGLTRRAEEKAKEEARDRA